MLRGACACVHACDPAMRRGRCFSTRVVPLKGSRRNTLAEPNIASGYKPIVYEEPAFTMVRRDLPYAFVDLFDSLSGLNRYDLPPCFRCQGVSRLEPAAPTAFPQW